MDSNLPDLRRFAQAVLCGYATDETLQLQPLSQQLAAQLAARMDAQLGSVKATGKPWQSTGGPPGGMMDMVR